MATRGTHRPGHIVEVSHTAPRHSPRTRSSSHSRGPGPSAGPDTPRAGRWHSWQPGFPRGTAGLRLARTVSAHRRGPGEAPPDRGRHRFAGTPRRPWRCTPRSARRRQPWQRQPHDRTRPSLARRPSTSRRQRSRLPSRRVGSNHRCRTSRSSRRRTPYSLRPRRRTPSPHSRPGTCPSRRSTRGTSRDCTEAARGRNRGERGATPPRTPTPKRACAAPYLLWSLESRPAPGEVSARAEASHDGPCATGHPRGEARAAFRPESRTRRSPGPPAR